MTMLMKMKSREPVEDCICQAQFSEGTYVNKEVEVKAKYLKVLEVIKDNITNVKSQPD